jgi:excisionase family DNA binding protein
MVGTDGASITDGSMMKIADVAKRLGVSLACVYEIAGNGQLQCYRFGTGRGTIRISEEQFQQFLKNAATKRTASRPAPQRAAAPTSGQHIK